MKAGILTIIFLILAVAGVKAQDRYWVEVDSLKFMKMQAGKIYQLRDGGKDMYLTFQKIENDTFFFKERKFHYKEITEMRNPKRKAVLDAILFPVTIGSCIAMSAFPINYFIGYFGGGGTDAMMQAVIFMGVQTVVFYIARNYLGTNKRWIDLSGKGKLNYGKVK